MMKAVYFQLIAKYLIVREIIFLEKHEAEGLLSMIDKISVHGLLLM